MGEEEQTKPAEEDSKNSSVVVAVTGVEQPKTQEEKMVVSDVRNSALQPSWFTPKRLLALFCVINLINYLDRGTIASNGVNGERKTCSGGKCSGGSGIQGEFNLSNFEDGVLSSAFMVGLLLASPIFATLAKSMNPFRLIGVGLLVWTIAIVGCACSWDFWSISIARMLVGVGEASFISLAAPFIDDNAPDTQRTAWLGFFYMCIPVGYAVGYIFGGLVGSHLAWRWAFWLEAILMVPFVILGFVMKPLQLKGFAPAGSKKASSVETVAPDALDSEILVTGDSEEKIDDLGEASKSGNVFTRFLSDMKVLLSEKVYVVNVLGYISYNFVLGAYSYWGPKAGYNIYNMANADMVFGGITVGCGLAGTIGGGLVLDYINSTLSNAFKLLSASTFLGAVFCFGAFCFKKEIYFLIFFAIGELLVFATQAPVNYVCLHSVKPSLRPLSMAMSTVSIHVFGDVPSSPLVGVLQDHIHNWRKTALILTSILFLAAAIWFIGIFFRSPDKFNEESEHNISELNNTNKAPLLDEEANTA
ncbi:probable sphingolipid transporter spinster homolog 2 [Chenopodium quinoa]|uniref:probable sphingolipid transporter spinster homolog 2 n=1 Tax=Chenopodium quinoa TaxID=63459 RepID=UPI000B781D19|nr:probable sphingolipid transporter spinster homolog 2 [Chenopodium quinoa]